MICMAFNSLICCLDALSIKFSYSRHLEAWGDLPEREEGQHVHLQTRITANKFWKCMEMLCDGCLWSSFWWRCRRGPTCQTLASLPSPARAYAGKAGFTDLWKLHHVCLQDLAAFNSHSLFALFNLFHMISSLQMFHSEPSKLTSNPGVISMLVTWSNSFQPLGICHFSRLLVSGSMAGSLRSCACNAVLVSSGFCGFCLLPAVVF